MGETSQVAAEALAEGIQNVLKDEAILPTWLSKAQDLRVRATRAMASNGYDKRKIVASAAGVASRQFQINDAYNRINSLFKKIQDAINAADHSSSEDDIFRAAVAETEQDIAEALETIYNKYYKKYDALSKIENDITGTVNNQEMTQLLTEGYAFLNEIGETVRNTTIIYQVQLEVEGTGQHKTGFFTLAQLLPYLKASTYTLKNGKQQYSSLRFDEARLKADIDSGKLKTLQWTKKREADYAQYIKVLKLNEQRSTSRENAVWKSNIARGNLDDIYINEGNAMENFQMMASSIIEQTKLREILAGDDHQLHTSLHSTLQNTVAYWQDSDFKGQINRLLYGLTGQDDTRAAVKAQLSDVAKNGLVDIQEKLSNATFTSLNSLFTQLIEVESLLLSIQSAQINKSQVSEATDFLDKALEVALEQFVSKFLPGTS